MPFQVVFSTLAIPPGIISSFTAGDDITSICSTGETLTAIVIGDLVGHVVEWEQISGTAVTWITPLDQLSVSYTAVDFQDKSFRFYIDRGTPAEQFDDLTVFGTPTDKDFIGGTADRNCFVQYNSPLNCRRATIRLVDDFLFDQSIDGSAGCNSTNYSIVWSAPSCAANNIVQYVVQEKTVTGPWNDMIIIPKNGATKYTPLIVGAQYRVGTVYRDLHNFSIQYSYPPVSALPDRSREGKNIANANDTDSIGGDASRRIYATIPTYSVLVRTKILKNPPDEEDYIGGDAARRIYATIPTYSVLIRTKIIKDAGIEDDFYGGDAARVIYATIPTYSVLDLTGGGIGGGG